MNKLIPTGPYAYCRSTDGCDDTFHVTALPSGDQIVDVHFWEDKTRAEAMAGWLTASLNLSHALSEVANARRATVESKTGQAAIPLPADTSEGLRRERMRRCKNALGDYTDFDEATNLIDLLADSMHWCREYGHSFEKILATATMHFESETNQ